MESTPEAGTPSLRLALTPAHYVLAATAVAPAQAATCKAGILANLPITMQGWRPIVQTTIDGKPAPFILDSGASYSMMPAPVAKAPKPKASELMNKPLLPSAPLVAVEAPKTKVSGNGLVNEGVKIDKRPVTPLEMLAQAMVCSNEFVYLN